MELLYQLTIYYVILLFPFTMFVYVYFEKLNHSKYNQLFVVLYGVYMCKLEKISNRKPISCIQALSLKMTYQETHVVCYVIKCAESISSQTQSARNIRKTIREYQNSRYYL